MSRSQSELLTGLLKALGEVMEDMRHRDSDRYWYGQLTAALDSAGIDIYEATSNHRLVEFQSDEVPTAINVSETKK